MEQNIIITIGREFGSEGHEIGKKLSEKIGVPLYDKDLLGLAAKNGGIDLGMAATADETVANRFLAPYIAERINNETLNDRLFKEQTRIIRDLAEKESCVIIGRLADFILKDLTNCLKVFVYAPFEDRVKIIQEKHGISRESAKKLVRRMDNSRNTYYSYYSNKKWNHKEGKDVLLNRSTFGVDGCVEILESIVKSFQER